MTDDTDSNDQTHSTRRSALLAGLGILSWSAIASTRVSADPDGTFPAPTDDPLLRLRAERLALHGRQTDPTNPDDGTIWYRDDL